MFINFLQKTEENLATQKEKLSQRFIGFARSMIDNLYDEKINDLSSTYNNLVYKLQRYSKLLICAFKIPSLKDMNDVYSHLNEPIM